MKWALYDLRWNPPGYDFLQFVQTLPQDVEAIRFKPGSAGDHGSFEDEIRKLHKIAFRICDSFGLKYMVSQDPVGEEVFPPKVINAHSLRHMRLLEKPRPLIPKNKADIGGRILVVLRESPIQPLRNSGPDWRRWAKDHDAMVLEDAQKTDMGPEEIAAYMDSASLTMGVISGVMSLAVYSEHRPYLMFRCISLDYRAISVDKWEKHGWKIGDQMPWAGKHQRMIWSTEDDYQTLEDEYQKHLRAVR